MKCVALSLIVLLSAPVWLSGRRLPIETYTTAEGLARDHIRCIVQDSHGFLWFCTTEGLSRFDGYEFVNYQVEQGLPSNVVNDFLETSDGVYWVATDGGLCRFDARGNRAHRFHCAGLTGEHGVPAPWRLELDGAGGVWVGTLTAHDGLYHLRQGDRWFEHFDLKMVNASVTALLRARNGILWVGSPEGLYRLTPDGRNRLFTMECGLPNDFIMALLEDSGGRIWVGTRHGLARIDGEKFRVYGMHDGLPGERIESLAQTRDGSIWVGTVAGLAERPAEPVQGHREFQSYTLAQGLTARTVGALAEDRDGNLWVGTFGSGAMKVARNGFTTYGEEDGVSFVASFFEGRDHQLCAVSRPDADLRIGCYDGQRFRSIRPEWPSGMQYFGWGQGQIVAQDANSEWWFATGRGLFRFGGTAGVKQLGGARPIRVYTKRDGLPNDDIFRVFADSKGGVWIGTIGTHGGDGLARLDIATSALRVFGDADDMRLAAPTGFAEDRAGNVWIGLYHGGLARYRDGKFERFKAAERLDGSVNSVAIDSKGRLWIATSLGLVRVEDPTQERIRFERFRTKDGLGSDDISAVTEDRWGRIYAATGRGIDRFQPGASGLGPVKHYTRADGIVQGELDQAFCDRDGNLWFSTPLGVSRLEPGQDRAAVSPPVLITGLSLGGVAQAVPDLGAASIAGLRIPRSALRIDFVGLGYSPGETLRYEYRLRNEDAAWSSLTDQRSVTYAKLNPGDYVFQVRAAAGDGTISREPATVAFTVLPPLWRTWWFGILCLACTGAAAYGLHRYRVKQLLAVANVRTRIATDLHDDIGASLSQIAILSEVAQREGAGSQEHDPLPAIAGISRQVVDAMSDIVWAIAPEHDRLSNLTYRMRRFAADLLSAQGMQLEFRTGVAEHDLKVGAHVRRELYLIFKEAIHNVARHSGASRVEVALEREGSLLYLRVRDDGRGFDPDGEYEGRGLRNIRARVDSLGGKVRFESAQPQGTAVWVMVRLSPAKTLSGLRGKSGKNFG